jgi:hypothetical protein
MKSVFVHDSVDEEKIWKPNPTELGKMFLKILESVYPTDEWKKHTITLEFNAKESPDALHLTGVIVRNAPSPDKIKESGKTFEAKDGHLAVDFIKELESLE